MLLNRLHERASRLRPITRALARRARDRRRQLLPVVPIVLVPSILGTRLVDARGDVVWGSVGRLYAGPPLANATALAGLLSEFPIARGVLAYDVFGGLVRFLEQVGGYRRGDDLHVLAYDWRAGIPHASAALDEVLDGIGGEVDVVCVSTGGLAARYSLAQRTHRIRRVVYIGTPHRGSFSALSYLVDGVRPAPLGKRFGGVEVATLQTAWDAMPHPSERVFVDERGARLELELYDPETWRRHGLGRGVADLDARLAHARRVWSVLDRPVAAPPAYVIGARHLPTIERVVVERGVARIPPCSPPRLRASVPGIYEPGDSSVSARSLCAAPGLARTWFVTPPSHRQLPTDRDVHHGVLEALL